MSVSFVSRKSEWLPAVLAAMAFAGCFAAFVWQLFVYQKDVRVWSEADLKSRAELAASTLAEPLRTLDFKAIQKVANQLKADGLRLRITQGDRFFVSEGDGLTGFFDTCGEPYPADIPCIFKVARTDGFCVGVGRPAFQMLMPFLKALLVIALAAFVGIAGVLLFFFVTYRQRVRIRELARLEKFRREFIADVSHEIKTPLTGILGVVDILSDGSGKDPSSSPVQRLLPMLKKESVRLNGLVQSILDLARLEREGEVLNRAETNLVDLIREVVETLAPAADAAGISLVFEPSPRPLRDENANIDPQLVSRAVSNLIANAIRHSGSKDIVVALESAGKGVRIVVEDHGIGIPSEHAARIFERFHRVDSARAAETGGAGLGLAIVRRIARLHGGEVALSAAKPQGSRFTLTLP